MIRKFTEFVKLSRRAFPPMFVCLHPGRFIGRTCL
jgi:hypothetical protein